ncbi:hypothetical protein M3Y99_00619000 [Aphelenchoides fujianensis]|nr:hypothetical protein M3Y99_00619000 [Aphelenchoides fujianensis]
MLLRRPLIHALVRPLHSLCCGPRLSNRSPCVEQKIDDLIPLLLRNQAQLGLLRQLTIQNSPVANLTSRFFDGLYIKKLVLQNCGIQRVDARAFDGLANTLQDLNLAHNKLTEFPAPALARLSSLLTINFSNNSIGDLTAEHALPNLLKLFEVNLGNNKIGDVHKTFFDNVKNNIQSINLGHNQLKAVPASALRGFRQLVALHLHSNRIQTLESLSFMNLPVVSLLNLANNRIKSISRQAFINVPKLRYFYLTDNNIEDILPSQFASFEQLEMLDLSNNRLSNLTTGSFSNLPALKQLYLGNNRIAHIQPDAFTNSSINVLILESNQLEEVVDSMFRGLPQLQQVSLKENKIKNVHQNAFYDTPSLVMIDLSHNQIFDLAPSTFVSLQNILLLDLSYNKILRIPYSAFGRRVVTVLLQENPLVCTEKIHMLQQGVGVLIPTQEDVICGPQRSINDTIRQEPKAETAPSDRRTRRCRPVARRQPSGSRSERPSSTTRTPSARPSAKPNWSSSNSRRPAVSSRVGHEGEPQLNPTIPPIPGMSAEQSAAEEIPQRPTGKPTNRPTTAGSELPIRKLNISNNIQRVPTAAGEQKAEAPKEGSIAVHDDEQWTDRLVHSPGRIYPLPVPFLNEPKKIHPAISLGSQTLPPSIVIAPHSEVESNDVHSSEQPTVSTSSKGTEKPKEVEEKRRNEIFEIDELNRRTEPSGLDAAAPSVRAPVDTAVIQGDRNLPTLMIVICLSTVGVVLLAVFVGMCFVHRRRGGMPFTGSSSSSVTTRSNTSNSATYATPTQPDEVHTWLYAPGPYSAYPNK